ncbi:MAG: biopolymer transporter ExbD [Colwellia sp.]|nr:biopolymer transporter ExbD [Colwellia sp.]
MTQLHSKRVNKKSADDALIPLINIVFLLLIFFMVAGSIQPSIPVDISHPIASEVDNPIKPLAVQIVLTRDNTIYWNEQEVTIEKVQQAMKEQAPSKVNLHLASQIKAIEFEPLLNVIREHQATAISLITVQQGDL